MSGYFFRVEHDLLRSEAFKILGGSAIKVYLVIGLYSDFGTDWAYPSIRTIARQAGVSRQTVLAAVGQLTKLGLLATSKSKGRSTAYRIIRQAPQRSGRTEARTPRGGTSGEAVPNFLLDLHGAGQKTLIEKPDAGPDIRMQAAGCPVLGGQRMRPQEEQTRNDGTTTSVPIPGTPFQLTAEGRLLVAVDLRKLLTSQGIPEQLAQRLLSQRHPEAVAKVLLNAFYLQSEGKLQNSPGYIRAGIEDGYELLPQVANRLENRRRELEARLRRIEAEQRQARDISAHAAEQSAVTDLLERLAPADLIRLTQEAVTLLPEPIVKCNPTLSNPFIRAKVYELACRESTE